MADKKPEYELYKVKKDTFQLNNLAVVNPALVAEFEKSLEDWERRTNNTFEDPYQLDLESMITNK